MGAYYLMIDVIETRVPSFSSVFEDLSRTSICLAIVQTVYYNVKKRVWTRPRAVICQEVRHHPHVCALYGGVHLRIAIYQVVFCIPYPSTS